MWATPFVSERNTQEKWGTIKDNRRHSMEVKKQLGQVMEIYYQIILDSYKNISIKYVKLRFALAVSRKFRYLAGGNVAENLMENRSSLRYLIPFCKPG